MSTNDMDQKELILESIKEFIESAEQDEKNQRLRSAVTMYFKAITEICDFIIFNKILKTSKNHTERYELLERFFPEIYNITSPLFKIYRKTYSQKVSKEDLIEMKNATKQILNKAEINKYL